MAKAKILIIEDDRDLADVLAYNMRQAGYDAFVAYDGQDGVNQALLRTPDVVVLDIMLPVLDGHEVCRRLRSDPATRDARIVMLTAKSEETDELVGFTLGADDYVTKPFSVKILLERIKALQRRTTAEPSADDVIAQHGVVLDRRRHRATVNGQAITLTRSEFKLLDTLLRQPGRVFQRSELIDSALGEDTMVLERTIDVHIRALRRKMGDAASLIETVRGVGYRFRDPDAAD